jgi:hypothetical protein
LTPLELETLALAASCMGERETDGPNNSAAIRQWLAHVNLKPPSPYCAAWASYVIFAAGMRVPVLPKFKRSSGALRLHGLNPTLGISLEEAVKAMAAGRPVVFIQDHGGGKGHCGFGIGTDGGRFTSLEANTGPGPAAPAADRDGQGCYKREDRRLDSVKHWLRIA